MFDNIEDYDWIPCQGYPGFEISAYGPVCRVKKDGTREFLMPYKDKKSGNDWMYVTLYQNYQFKKVAIRTLIKENWIPEIERRKKAGEPLKKAHTDAVCAPVLIQRALLSKEEKQSQQNTSDFKRQSVHNHTTNPAEQAQKFKEMIDGFNPARTSATAYIKYLRQQGYRFTTHHLSTALAKKTQEYKRTLVEVK